MEVTKHEFVQLCQSNHSGRVLMALCEDETFIDVTLTAEGHSVKAHKSVLAAVSPYFKSVLSDNPCQHPVIIMPHNVLFEDLLNVIDYIYKGEVSVDVSQVSSLLQTAKILQISGLIGVEDCTTLFTNFDASSDAKLHKATKYVPPSKEEIPNISGNSTTFKSAKNLPLERNNQNTDASSDCSTSSELNMTSVPPSTKEKTFTHYIQQRVPSSLSVSARNKVIAKYGNCTNSMTSPQESSSDMNMNSQESSLDMSPLHHTVFSADVDYHKDGESKPRIVTRKFYVRKNAVQKDGDHKRTLKPFKSSRSMSSLEPSVLSTNIDSYDEKGEENVLKENVSFSERYNSSTPVGKRRRKMPSNLKDYVTEMTEMDIMQAVVNSPVTVDSHVISSSSTASKNGTKTTRNSLISNTVIRESEELLPGEMLHIKEEVIDIEDVPLT